MDRRAQPAATDAASPRDDRHRQAFPGVTALAGVDFSVRAGEVHGAGRRERRRQIDADQDPVGRRYRRIAGEIRIAGETIAASDAAPDDRARRRGHLSGADAGAASDRRGEHLPRPPAAHAASGWSTGAGCAADSLRGHGAARLPRRSRRAARRAQRRAAADGRDRRRAVAQRPHRRSRRAFRRARRGGAAKSSSTSSGGSPPRASPSSTSRTACRRCSPSATASRCCATAPWSARGRSREVDPTTLIRMMVGRPLADIYPQRRAARRRGRAGGPRA